MTATNTAVKKLSDLEKCKVLLRVGRSQIIAYIRKTWLESLFPGSGLLYSFTYEKVSTYSMEWKKEWVHSTPSRFEMRKACALGKMRWGLFILKAATTYGESVAEVAEEALYSKSGSDITPAEILPPEHFGQYPLGDLESNWWFNLHPE